MHLCLTVECIASSLQFLQHCLSVFQSISFNLIRSHPPTVLRQMTGFDDPPPPPATTPVHTTLLLLGADLANLMNESAILAGRRNKTAISNSEIDDAIDRIVAGMEGTPMTDGKAKTLVAYHEVGHAICGTLTEGHDAVQKVCSRRVYEFVQSQIKMLTKGPRSPAAGVCWRRHHSRAIDRRQSLTTLSETTVAISHSRWAPAVSGYPPAIGVTTVPPSVRLPSAVGFDHQDRHFLCGGISCR